MQTTEKKYRVLAVVRATLSISSTLPVPTEKGDNPSVTYEENFVCCLRPSALACLVCLTPTEVAFVWSGGNRCVRHQQGCAFLLGGAAFLEGVRVMIQRVLQHTQITSNNALSLQNSYFLITKETLFLQITQEFGTKDIKFLFIAKRERKQKITQRQRLIS